MSEEENSIPTLASLAKTTGVVDLIKEIYGDLAKPGLRQIGLAFGTVFQLAGWPLTFASGAADIALKANLERLRARMEKVPEHAITTPIMEIAVPVAEKMRYVRDQELAAMYVELLAKTCIVASQHEAHPSFVHVLATITPDEARIIGDFGSSFHKTAIWMTLSTGPAELRRPDDIALDLSPSVRLQFEESTAIYLQNMFGLGLMVESSYETPDQVSAHYRLVNKLMHRHDFGGQPGKYPMRTGTVQLTPLGVLFGHCVIPPRESPF